MRHQPSFNDHALCVNKQGTTYSGESLVVHHMLSPLLIHLWETYLQLSPMSSTFKKFRLFSILFTDMSSTTVGFFGVAVCAGCIVLDCDGIAWCKCYCCTSHDAVAIIIVVIGASPILCAMMFEIKCSDFRYCLGVLSMLFSFIVIRADSGGML